MPMPKKTDPTVQLNVKVAGSIYAKMELELFSEVMGGVPHGAKARLIESLVRDWLEARGVIC